jgi:hypothetical protein
MASPTVIDAAWTFDDQNTAQNGRFVMGAFFQNAAASTASNSAWRDGVIPGVFSVAAATYRSYHVTQNSPTGSSVLVQPGHAVVTRTGQGLYVCPNSAARVVALDAADVTNPRIDLIVLQVQDQPLGDPVTQAQVRAVTGTPSGSPVAPATPTGAIVLARVAVAAAPTGNTIVDANITDLRRTAGLAGAIRLLLPGDSVSDAGVPGDLRYVSQDGLFSRYTSSGGGLWQPFAKTNQGFGYVSDATYTADGGASASEFVGRSHTFTALANRKYKVTWQFGVLNGSPSNFAMRNRWAAGGSVTTASTQTQIMRTRYDTNGHISTYHFTAYFNGPAAGGSTTVGLTIESLDGIALICAGNPSYENKVLVEDIGGV